MPDNVSKPLFEMTSEELIAYFGSSPFSWACHGVGLLRSAYVVWGTYWGRLKRSCQEATASQRVSPAEELDMSTDRFIHAYKLLAALAMENLAKGLVIAQDKLVISGNKLPREFLTHDIVSILVQNAGFQLNKHERMALADSTKAIIWQARYPMPKGSAHLAGQCPGMGFAQWFYHPVSFRKLGTRMLQGFPEDGFQGGSVSASDLIRILTDECPPVETLKRPDDG